MKQIKQDQRKVIYSAYKLRKDTNENIDDIAKRFGITSRTIFNIKREIENDTDYISETTKIDALIITVEKLQTEVDYLKSILAPKTD